MKGGREGKGKGAGEDVRGNSDAKKSVSEGMQGEGRKKRRRKEGTVKGLGLWLGQGQMKV